MKILIYSILSIMLVLTFSSCNKEWKSEQYQHYVSFKAPLNDDGVTAIHIPYRSKEKVTYELPIIVSGSNTNEQSLLVHMAVDPDTLQELNFEQFQQREDLYYKELSAQYFSMPDTVFILPGKDVSIVNIDFDLKDIDLVNKWILPLAIEDDPSYNYASHPRKHYNKALLRIIPFNDYSGDYSGTSLKIYLKDDEDESAIVKSTIRSYVIDNNSVFFYAGTMDEDDVDRGKYKINAKFNDTANVVEFSTDNPEMEFKLNKEPSYSIEEIEDEVLPYLVHRYVTIHNIDYNYTDYTSVPNAKIEYAVKGSLIMERKINTQIPDKDQAIEW